ncbi:hypothetical protein JCM5350_007001 [Sporobolomyces pararoseus]
MSTPLRPRTSVRRNSSFQSAVSSTSSLDSLYPSSKTTSQLQENSQLKPSSFSLLPPPSQSSKSKVERRKKRETTLSTPSLSHGDTSKRARPEPRPVGVPRPPTATKSKRKRESGNHSTFEQSSLSLPSPSSSSSSSVTLSATPSFTADTLDPQILQSLATTPWSLIDPINHFFLSSSRLFQLSHLELGQTTVERRKDLKKDENDKIFLKYGQVLNEKGKCVSNGNAREVKEVLDRLERERSERLGLRKGKGKEVSPGDEPSWARDREGIEWEIPILKKLSSRLSTSKTEEFIPLVWANDLETRIKRASLGSLECWILGKEFPCRKVVLVGWILAREEQFVKETDTKLGWSYLIDDGTGLVEVFCPVNNDNTNRYDPRILTNPHSIKPELEPKLLIEEFYLSTASKSSEFKLKRSYSHLEETSASDSTVFSEQTLVRIVGSITPPQNWYDSKLRITAERIEPVSPDREINHHSTVNKLWNEVYSREVDVRGMLEKIEREEKELKRQRELEEQESLSVCSSTYGDLSSTSASSTSDPVRKYRPTRPAKLSSDDITLTNFIIYIRHHLVKHHIQSSSSSSLFTPPPSSQSSLNCPPLPTSSSSEDPNRQRDEWCLPFDIDSLRSSSKHLELFARRLSLERDRKEREKKKRQRKRQKMNGDFTLLDSSNFEREGERESVWISGKKSQEGGIVEKRVREKIGSIGTSKLVKTMMLPPPSANTSSTRSVKRERDNEEEDAEEFERELVGKRLDKEIKRCWEDAIRLMRKNGMIVEYVSNSCEGQQEEEKEEELNLVENNDRRSRTLPDEPRSTRHGINYTRNDSRSTPLQSTCSATRRSKDSKEDSTPRASRTSQNSSLPLASTFTTTSRQQFQLVTAVSLAPLVLEHIRDISDSNYASSYLYSRSSRPSIKELDVRLALYRDDRWSAVAKYGEVVKRSLELLEEWGEIVETGEGFRLA